MRALILSVALAAATLSGCAGMSSRDQRIGSGAIIGGVAGGALSGSGTGAVIGAIAGGLIGSEVDRNRSDRRMEDQRRRYDDCRRYSSRYYCDNQRY